LLPEAVWISVMSVATEDRRFKKNNNEKNKIKKVL
jgi:hypothetical protein